MLDTATIIPAAGEPFDIQVDFRVDGEIVFGGAAQTIDFSIEFQLKDAQLKRDSQLVINGTRYRSQRDPVPMNPVTSGRSSGRSCHDDVAQGVYPVAAGELCRVG